MQSWRNPFLLLCIVRNEDNTGFESVLACWVVSWGYWLHLECVPLVWLSDIRAAGLMSRELYGFRMILELCCSSTELVCWSLLGSYWGFSMGSENVIPFSVHLSDFCRSFREERNTTIKIYITHHVLLVKEVYNVIKRNSVFDIWATIWYNIIFRTQNRMNCKLLKIIRREYGFIVVIHRFLQRGKLFNFGKGWALKSDCRQVLLKNFTIDWVRW